MSLAKATVHEPFAHAWSAKVLNGPPMIAPARQFVYPLAVAGEEDALNRGAMFVSVRPVEGGEFLATCALGFRERSLPSGVWSLPNPAQMLALAGGYAYLVDTARPAECVHLPMKPVTRVLAAVEERLLLLAGFHDILAVGAAGVVWQSERLSWEGVAMNDIVGGALHGTGWNMMADRDVPFVLDLRTGRFTGGGFSR